MGIKSSNTVVVGNFADENTPDDADFNPIPPGYRSVQMPNEVADAYENLLKAMKASNLAEELRLTATSIVIGKNGDMVYGEQERECYRCRTQLMEASTQFMKQVRLTDCGPVLKSYLKGMQ